MGRLVDENDIYKLFSDNGTARLHVGDIDILPRVNAVSVKWGHWEWFEEWNPSTPEHPRECDDCGWRCSNCKTALVDIVGGYWDNPDDTPKLNYCPECGTKIRVGGDENA